MALKRNRLNLTITTTGYIETYFGTDIGKILTPSSNSLAVSNTPYVHHCEAEEKLSVMLERDPELNKSLAFTGLTGSGKTTVLRHVFNLNKNSNQLLYMDKKLIIPIDFNRSQNQNPQKVILNNIRAAVTTLCNDFQIDFPDTKSEGLYQFVDSLRRDQLFYDSEFSSQASHADQLHAFLQNQEMAFASCQFQYVLNNSNCPIELVILILDNVEAYDIAKSNGEAGLMPIVEAFRLIECISAGQNKDKWNFNMLFVCRHHIWRMLKGHYSTDDSNALLQSFITTEHPYDLSHPVQIPDIVEARDKTFARTQRRTWNQSVNIIKTVMQKMEGNIGHFILELHLKDMRRSMATLRDLIQHRNLQKETNEEIIAGAFQIDSADQFDLSRVNLIRTIGLGTNRYYCDNELIPNLLRNDRVKGIELFTLLSLKYFLVRCDYSEPSWDNSISISEFYSNMKFLFKYDDETMSRIFKQSIIYLIRTRMLLRSADQNQLIVEVNKKVIEEIEYVYVSGAAVVLWNELGNSSALFQLFMDDIWFDDDSDYLKESGNDVEHCCEYLRELFKIEKSIYNLTENLGIFHAKLYLEYFGAEPICKHLAAGLISSLRLISDSGESLRVNKAKIALGKTEKLSLEIGEWADANKQFLLKQ